MEINKLFKQHTTSTAFNLNISKNMVSFLAAVASSQELSSNSTDPNDSVLHDESRVNELRYVSASDSQWEMCVSGRACFRRGLVFSPNLEWPGIYHLTEAGRHVFELLKIAGLIVENPTFVKEKVEC